MDSEDTKTLAVYTERTDTNTKQIEELKSDVKSIKEEQKAIYEIASAVKLIGQEMTGMKADLGEIKKDTKQNQSDLISRMEQVEKKGSWDWMSFVRDRLIPWLILLGVGAYIGSTVIK